MILTTDIINESILDDEELQASQMKKTDLTSLIDDSVDDDLRDYEFYAVLEYYYKKLYGETYWWQNWFTAHLDILSVYEDVKHICTLSGLFKNFTIEPVITAYAYEGKQYKSINRTFTYPDLPTDFDVKAWYEEVESQNRKIKFSSNSSNKEFILSFRIFFNVNKSMSHKQFLKCLWKLLPGMNVLRRTKKDAARITFYRNDENPDDRVELTLVRESNHPESPLTFSANYMFTPEQFDALYTALTGREDYQKDSGRQHNYVQEKIIKTTNFPQLMKYAADQALAEYGIRLIPGEYQYPYYYQVYQRNLKNTSSWVAFTVENADPTKKELEIYDLEECIVDCLLYRMSIHYMTICEFAVLLKVIPKLTNNKAKEIREQFIKDNTNPNYPNHRIPNMTENDKDFHHFDDTKRPVVSSNIKMSNGKWNERVRDVSIVGQSTIFFMGDKNGAVSKNFLYPEYPAEAHTYVVSMMLKPDIWKDNKEHIKPEPTKPNPVYESIFDDLDARSFDDTKSTLTAKADREVEELGENPENLEYYILVRVRNVEPVYGKSEFISIAAIYDEIAEAMESSAIIPQRYYMTYPVLKNFLDRNKDLVVEFEPPLPDNYNLKLLYGSDYWKDVGATEISMKVYLNSLTFFNYNRYIREMNRMLGRLDQAVKCALPDCKHPDIAIQFYFTNPENHNKRQVLHNHEMYSSRCYQNGEQYRHIYSWMFPEERTKLNIVHDLDAESASVIIRKMDVRRLGENIENLAPNYGIEAKVINTNLGIPTDENPVSISWITVDLKSANGETRVDIRQPESLFADAVFRHITLDMVTNSHLMLFVRTHFEVYNKDLEERKSKGYKVRQSSYRPDEFEYPGKLRGETLTYMTVDTENRVTVKDIRVRKIERVYNTLGFVLYFDSKGRMGRKPFTKRHYSSFGNALEFIENIVQTGLIWRSDFKPHKQTKKKK